MRRCIVILLLGTVSAVRAASFATYCTPSGRVDQVILKRVRESCSDIRIATYSLDWPQLTEVLADRARQGVAVRVLRDGVKGETCVVGLEDVSRVETGPGSFHAKLAVFDGKKVLVGSANLTAAGLRGHHNNLLEIEDDRVAEFCCRLFDAWWKGETAPAVLRTPQVDIYVSPGADLARRICAEISGAGRSVRFLQYRFTDPEIATAVCAARRQGLLVAGVLDASGVFSSVADRLQAAGCLVRKSALAGILHDKTLIVDDRVVITGSYNLSVSARKNVELVVVVRDAAVARAYAAEWMRLWRWKSLPVAPA